MTKEQNKEMLEIIDERDTGTIRGCELSKAFYLKENYDINDRVITHIIFIENKLEKLYNLPWKDDMLTEWIEELETVVGLWKCNITVDGITYYKGKDDKWDCEEDDKKADLEELNRIINEKEIF